MYINLTLVTKILQDMLFCVSGLEDKIHVCNTHACTVVLSRLRQSENDSSQRFSWNAYVQFTH